MAAFRSLNRALDALEISVSLTDTAQMLYPEMNQKYFQKIIELTAAFSARLPGVRLHE